MPAPQAQRSVPEVLQDIVGNLQEIIRSEFRLAKTEIKEKAERASRPAATFGIGLFLACYGTGFLLLAAVYALSTVMAGWLAALLIGTILVLAALALLSSSGKQLKDVNPAPDRTIQNLEENVQWAKHQMK